MKINYRLADVKDIDEITEIISLAVKEMEKDNIYQWDEVYPTRTDFLGDIEKKYLYVGLIDEKISVVYTINMEYDVQYKNGSWEYPDSDFRIIHRLCVNPSYQNRGVAKETLNYIERELKDNGVEAIRLDVFLENPYALSLYRKNGYKEVGMANWRKGKFYLMEKHL